MYAKLSIWCDCIMLYQKQHQRILRSEEWEKETKTVEWDCLGVIRNMGTFFPFFPTLTDFLNFLFEQMPRLHCETV